MSTQRIRQRLEGEITLAAHKVCTEKNGRRFLPATDTEIDHTFCMLVGEGEFAQEQEYTFFAVRLDASGHVEVLGIDPDIQDEVAFPLSEVSADILLIIYDYLVPDKSARR